MPTHRPGADETAEYYFTYINQVPAGDVRTALDAQTAPTLALLRAIGDEQSRHRYAPEKWTIRQVLSHINDTERLFTFRALWFARGFDSALPSFDQDVAIASGRADDRSWQSHVDEFDAIRRSTVAFFSTLPDEAWARRGIASDRPFTVRALAYITVGHVAHHVRLLRDKYLVEA